MRTLQRRIGSTENGVRDRGFISSSQIPIYYPYWSLRLLNYSFGFLKIKKYDFLVYVYFLSFPIGLFKHNLRLMYFIMQINVFVRGFFCMFHSLSMAPLDSFNSPFVDSIFSFHNYLLSSHNDGSWFCFVFFWKSAFSLQSYQFFW